MATTEPIPTMMPPNGPWGKAGDAIITLVPIAVLLILILKPKPEPATFSLPVAAAILWVLRMLYFESLPNLVNAATVQGLLNAATPVAIGLGAIILFRAMHYTKSLDWLINLMKKVSHNNPIAVVMIIGWGFVYLVEGSAGFGTPVALAAPILQTFGFDPISVACLCLLNDGLETTFGAVGTPIFFGLSLVEREDGMGLSEAQFLDTTIKIAIINFICSLFVPILAMRMVIEWKYIKKSLVFIYLSIISCSGSAIAFAAFSYNFPSLLGGVVGLTSTMVLSHYKIGLNYAEKIEPKKGAPGVGDEDEEKTTSEAHTAPLLKNAGGPSSADQDDLRVETMEGGAGTDFEGDTPKKEPSFQDEEADKFSQNMSTREILSNTFPIWGTVLLLIITRVPQFKISDALQQDKPDVNIPLGTFGDLHISRSVKITLMNIFRDPDAPEFSFAFFFVPWFIPFIVIASTTMMIFRHRVDPDATFLEYIRPFKGSFWTPFKEGIVRMKNPTIALAGATTLAALLTASSEGENSPAVALGTVLSDALKDGWVAISVLIGGLGAFFAGSTAVSNLTFGQVQYVAASNLNLMPTSMLALQSVGGNLGNQIAIGNIVLVKAIMGTVKDVPEGVFVWKNLPVTALYCLVATACGFVLLFGIDNN